MSDLGNDVGNTGLSVGMKLTEAVLRIIGKIFSAFYERTSADYRLKKAQLKNQKNEDKLRSEAEKLAKQNERIQSRIGYINHSLLENSGVKLTSCDVRMTEEDLKHFASYCKREGILISGIEDVRVRALEGKKIFTLCCKEQDLERVADLIDLMNAERRIDKIKTVVKAITAENKALEKELTSIHKKRDATEEDIERAQEIETKLAENEMRILEFNKEIEHTRHAFSEELNAEISEGVLDDVFSPKEEELKSYSFDEALDRYTGKSIDEGFEFYVVDAKKPDNYIKCQAENATYKDENYTKTTYEVYKDGEKVLTTNDERFDGRAWNYWQAQKNAMREAGEFSDMMYKFNSAEEMNAYREAYHEQNRSELEPLKIGKDGRNYDNLIELLEGQLNDAGYSYRNGILYDGEKALTAEVIGNGDYDSRLDLAEAVVIARQIENYREIADLENEIAIKQADALTEGRDDSEADVESLKGELESALNTEKALAEDRNAINAVQAELDLQSEETKIDRMETEIADFEKEFDELYSKWETENDIESFLEAKNLRTIIDWKKAELAELKGEGNVAENTSKRKMKDYTVEVGDRKQVEPKTVKGDKVADKVNRDSTAPNR